MARRSSTNSSALYRSITICIVLALASSILIIAVFMQATAAVCSTTSSGVVFSIIAALPTIAIVGLRCYLTVRQRTKSLQTISPSTASPRLESTCVAGVQLLVLLWVILACVNLLVAVRAPICLSQPLAQWQSDLKEQNWRYGPPCRLHRALVALSVLMALSVTFLSFLDSIDKQQSRQGTSLISCYFTCRKPHKTHGFAPSISSSQSGSTSYKEDPLYLIPEYRPSQFEHEQWQRRRSSLSSQKAIYPHRYQWHDQRPRYASHSLSPSRYSSTLRSVSEGHRLDIHERNSSMTSSQSSRTWSNNPPTRPSTMSSSRSRASSNPERGILRREDGTKSAARSSGVPDVPPLPVLPPPAWAPALHHTPLSADPALRALSTGSLARPALQQLNSSPNLLVQPLHVKKRETTPAGTKSTAPEPVKQADSKPAKSLSPRKQLAPPMPSDPPPPIPSMVLSTQPPPAALSVPSIPARAPGHSASSSISTNTSVPRSNKMFTSETRPATRPPAVSMHSSSSRTSLRRPDPIRHRQYYHLPTRPNQYKLLDLPQTQSQLAPPMPPLPAPTSTPLPLQHYQHQRVWKNGYTHPHAGATRNLSVYSASSYGTHDTDARVSTMTMGTYAYAPSIRPSRVGMGVDRGGIGS